MNNLANLGNIDNQYTIRTIKHRDLNRVSCVARNNQTQIDYIFELSTGQNYNNFPANEIKIGNILNNKNNPYILRYIGNGNGTITLNNNINQNKPYVIYENASNNDLNFYNQSNQTFSERQAKLIFKKILEGIKAIHNSNLCHRDIKLDNILLDNDYNPKIYGFHFCCENSNDLKDFLGTYSYTAPEILLRKAYNGQKADIFSLGQLLFKLVNKTFGFESSKNDKLYKFIKLKQYPNFWNSPIFHNLNLSESFKKLFVRMIAYNPNERPLIDEILNDEWMKEINNLNAEQMNDLENEVKVELQQREAEIHINPADYEE
jgi:serine/threonine protein kinase